MNPAILGLYGVFFLAVVFAGNGDALVLAVREDARDFLPWLIAVILLAALAESDKTKPLVAPFALLLLLNFVLRRWGVISGQFKTLLGQPQTAPTLGGILV